MKKILIFLAIVIIVLLLLLLSVTVTSAPTTDTATSTTATTSLSSTTITTTTTSTTSATSTLSNTIHISYPQADNVITSPLVVKGEARGTWFFEASFAVTLTNWDGVIIAEGNAQAQKDWMTTDFVPFVATLNFTSTSTASSNKRGFLILKKDNPSGLPQHDASVEIPIYFK